jgi:hypothetical protein
MDGWTDRQTRKIQYTHHSTRVAVSYILYMKTKRIKITLAHVAT